MAILPIITAPDARLKVRSRAVEHVDNDVRRLMDSMLETMYDAPGIGLSAIQVGVAKRVIVIDVAADGEKRQPLCLANPELVTLSDTAGVYNEGCLSLPEQFADLERPERVTIQYLDYSGDRRTLEADGLLARCVQHEMDHLDGILFVDHLSSIKRNMILRKLAKARRQKVPA